MILLFIPIVSIDPVILVLVFIDDFFEGADKLIPIPILLVLKVCLVILGIALASQFEKDATFRIREILLIEGLNHFLASFHRMIYQVARVFVLHESHEDVLNFDLSIHFDCIFIHDVSIFSESFLKLLVFDNLHHLVSIETMIVIPCR